MRLFVAVWPPGDAVDRLAALDRPDVAGLRWTRPDQWHVTLRFLGEIEDVEPVVSALSALDVLACDVTMGPAVKRLGSRVLMVPVVGLEDVAGAVVDATADLGQPPDRRAFRGHVTLARARGRVDFGPLVGAPVSASWHVSEVAVVRSRLHPHGARYETVAAVPLGR